MTYDVDIGRGFGGTGSGHCELKVWILNDYISALVSLRDLTHTRLIFNGASGWTMERKLGIHIVRIIVRLIDIEH